MRKLHTYYAYTHAFRGDNLIAFRTPIVAEDRESAKRYALDPRNKIARDPSELISIEQALDLAEHTISELERFMSIEALSHCISADALDVLLVLATEYLLTPSEAQRNHLAAINASKPEQQTQQN